LGMKKGVSVKESGVIKEIRKFVVKVKGLSNCMVGQLVSFADDTKGFVIGYNEEEVLVLLLKSGGRIKANDAVYSEWQTFNLPVGENFLGRIVNALCEPLDGKGPVRESDFYDIFRDAPGVLERVPIDEMLQTGIRAIDSSIPVGKGQRQLIIGDRMTGKTSIAVDTILNQKDKNVICIYCCIGRDYASFEKVVAILAENNALDYTTVVAGSASSSIGEQYLAPYTATTLGEYFMHSGRDVFVVFDDLTKHAWAYREISLLLERPPGREAYPGDIFYIHARLMERAGRLSPESGGGSMTFFPIADTQQGDIAGFIPTNLISMTDGQIYLNSALFGEGFKPAIDLGLSVSRIGSKVQSGIMRELTKDVGLDYIRYRELLKATKLRAGVSEELNARLRRGEKTERILIQNRFSPSPLAEQLILFCALRGGVFDKLSEDKCEYFKRDIYAFARDKFPHLVESLEKEQTLSPADRKSLNECIVSFFKE